MAYKNFLVLLVGALFFALASAESVNAFGQIVGVEVNGVNALSGINFANFAGDRIPVLITFRATQNAEDVRIKAWISGERENAVVSERFDTIADRTYTQVVYLPIPSDLDRELDESRKLDIVVESKNQATADEKVIDLTVQRESYQIQILSVQIQSEVKAGTSVPIDVVLKNRGRQSADDNFLKVSIPELGIETRTYFGDLSPIDQGGNVPDKDDAVERRAFLKVPSNVPAGLYTLQLEAYNADSSAKMERKLVILGAGEDTKIVSSATTKTFQTGEKQIYRMTVVNKGTSVGVYEISINAPKELNVEADESVIVVPAGSSRDVELTADSSEEGVYSFSASVQTENGQTIEEKNFKANVQGNGKGSVANNTTVLLTVILAIVFVVLLVVLIVLLTRKPAKTEEFGESYY